MLNITLMYASEKFYTAVGYMALSTGSLRERLTNVWMHQLLLIFINDTTSLPSEIQTKLSELSNKLHAGESSETGEDIVSLVDALNEDQVRDAISDIVDLYSAIIRAHVLGGPAS